MKKFLFLATCFVLVCRLDASYSPHLKKWVTGKHAPTLSDEKHYELGYNLVYENQWEKALPHFLAIVNHCKDSPYYAEALFYSGISYYFQSDFDIANRYFSQYLSCEEGELNHFEKALEFKYYIADYYSKSWRRHMFGLKFMPKIMNGKKDALTLYDEVIVALSGEELAVLSLWGKANIYYIQRKFEDSIETLKTLTRRHKLHSLAAESFALMSRIYLDQVKREAQNPDFIALAEINLRNFKAAFPSDPTLDLVKDQIAEMKEIYAESLFATGKFYERKKKPQSSVIYYRDLANKFPATEAAEKGRARIEALQPQLDLLANK